MIYKLDDKINLLLSEPLRSVGDAHDRLFKDSDGLWKVERNVREVELKGTKGWSTDSYRDKGYNYAYFRPDNFKAYGEIWSNILPYGNIDDDTRETVGKTVVITFNVSDSRTGVTSTDTADDRVVKIRDYLFSIEGAMVSYELATPTIETLDQELQDKLNWTPAPEDTTFNLTNTNIYAGDKQAYRAFLGERLIYGPAPLVYPNPPTEYAHEDLEGAVFYGAGKEQWYVGERLGPGSKLEGDYTMEPNGLRLNGGKAYFYTYHWARMPDGATEFTIENNFDHLSPGESETILNLRGAGQYNLDSTDFKVTKDSDGQVYIFGVPAPDTKFVHIYIYYYNKSTYSSFTMHVNKKSTGLGGSFERTTDSYMQEVYLTGNILIYDMKQYNKDRWVMSTNFEGINALEFVTTEQLLALMPDEPPVYLATDDDFGLYAGTPVYRGSELRVEIPHTIHGKKVTSLNGMFDGGTRRGTNGIEKVVNTNENITNVMAMFQGQETDHLDLSELYVPNATTLGSFFLDGKVKTLDMSGLKMRKLTNMYRSFRNTGLEKLDFRGLSTSEVSNSTESMLGTNIQLGYVDTQQDADFLNRPYYVEGDPFIVKE